MTDIVDRANKVLEGVTPGPWYTVVDEIATQVQGFPILDSEKYEIVGTEGFYGDYDTDWINARFIAEARELVPELVAEIERLRDALRIWIDMMEDDQYDAGEMISEFDRIARAALIDKEAGDET
jgi:hypothetical protein